MEPYLLALGYGGSLKAAARFEWSFRVRLGAEQAEDVAGQEEFIHHFKENGVEGSSYAILVEDLESPLLSVFAEFGKQAVAEDPDLWLFLVLEESENSNLQYQIQIEPDPSFEIFMPNQVRVDIENVPKEALLWMNHTLGVRFYEKDHEVMMEFPIEGIPL